MGHHIDSQGRFQSDKYPDTPPDFIRLSFRDPAARIALRAFCAVCGDDELAKDIMARIEMINNSVGDQRPED